VSTRSPAHNVAALLLRSARRFPALPAVAVGGATRHSYGALAARVSRLASALVDAGLSVGDRAALVANNCPEYVEALFACWQVGLCAVPINSKLHSRELAYVLQHAGARWAFVDAACAAGLGSAAREAPALERIVEFGSAAYDRLLARPAGEAPVAVARADPAWLFYTSGTTGRPKGAVLTHGNLLAMSFCFLADVEAVAPGDAILHAAPLSHGSGLYLLPHTLNAAVHVVPESGGFDAAEMAALLTRWPKACFFAAPTMVKRLVAYTGLCGAPLEHLKSIVYGGAPLYVEDCRSAFAVLGPRLAQIYGQGESPMTITAMSRALLADAIARDDEARLSSVGVAQTGIEIRIAGPDGADLPVGGTGEVCVRGPTVMQGYWSDPPATAAALADGWLHTGDIGGLDGDGFLTLKDRAKDLIISGGSNIYPREIEEVLQKHAAVAEVAVVGRKHPDWGEEVVACVVAGAGADTAALERELDALCLAHIARFKRPKVYVFVAELPKNNTGKVLKTLLRERVANDAQAESG
jgi:long-chain acyl-CoA synthetase